MPIDDLDPDRLFRLRTEESAYPQYHTGVLPTGEQVLLGDCGGHLVCARFTPAGELVGDAERHFPPRDTNGEGMAAYQRRRASALRAWLADLGVTEGPIAVRRFYLPGTDVGVYDYPHHVHYIERDEDDPAADPAAAAVAAWRELGRFVLHWGSSEYYVDRDGRVESS